MSAADHARGIAAAAEARRAKMRAAEDAARPVAGRMRPDGFTYEEIARALNRLGLRTSSGGPWHRTAVWRLFKGRS